MAPEAEARGDVIDWSRLFFATDTDGRILDRDAAYEATKRLIDPSEPPAFSSLVRKPLPAAYGGVAHHGGTNFTSTADPAYIKLADWIASEDDGGETAEPLTAAEQLFADTVQGALQSATCMTAACHGLGAAVPYRLDPGIDGHFSVQATRANYETSRTMLALDGDPRRSRLLTKGLPLHAGGVAHKGGNQAFFRPRADPRADAIVAWACAEREQTLGAPCLSEGSPPISGFVFVAGPLVPEDAFDLDQFTPGLELYLATVETASLTPASTEVLTAGLHDEPADVRDPAVDASGRKLAFAMRTSAAGGHDLWEMDLSTKQARRLTSDAGPTASGGIRTHREPTYGPRGHIWFVSTMAQRVADDGRRLDADLYELDPKTGVITQRTWTPHIERRPVFLVHGEENGGEVAFTALREAVPAQRRAHPFRFPPDLSTEYHQHFGITPTENLFDDVRELPDGRYAMIVGDLDNAWPAGRLGIIDRNFGPEIPADAAHTQPGLPGYAPPLVRLDPNTTATGTTAGAYRDPAPLPDGRILVSHTDAVFHLSDAGARPRFVIEVLSLETHPQTGIRIGARSVLVDLPQISAFDPQPIAVRQPAPIAHTVSWDPTAKDGLFVHNGLAMIDAVLSNLPPSGPKAVRRDFRFVRLVEALPYPPNARAPVAGAGTTTSLSGHGPARILSEQALAADGTFQARIDVGVSFRVQGLDADRMTVGTMHNRWYYLAPGQKLVQGTAASAYDQRCAPCHGATDGDPDHAFTRPDVLTSASVTLSRYHDGDARRPIEATRLGDETRITVDFVSDVQPILTRACAVEGCHIGANPAAGVDLGSTATARFNHAYESLMVAGVGSGGGGRYVDAATGRARTSYLVELIGGVELDAPRALGTVGAPHPSGAAALSDADRLTIIRWIELGASFVGKPAGGQ